MYKESALHRGSLNPVHLLVGKKEKGPWEKGGNRAAHSAKTKLKKLLGRLGRKKAFKPKESSENRGSDRLGKKSYIMGKRIAGGRDWDQITKRAPLRKDLERARPTHVSRKAGAVEKPCSNFSSLRVTFLRGSHLCR